MVASVQLLKVAAGAPTRHDTAVDSVQFPAAGIGVAPAVDGLTLTGREVLTPTGLKTGNYTVLASDRVILIGTLAGAVTHTLPAAPTAGQRYTFLDTLGTITTTNTLTISGNGNNINGAATLVVTTAYSVVELFFNGTTWNTKPGLIPFQEAIATQAISGSDTALTAQLTNTPFSSASVLAFFNGQVKTQGSTKDYTMSGKVITWRASGTGTAPAMATTDTLVVMYWY